jgi:hypothetical protein
VQALLDYKQQLFSRKASRTTEIGSIEPPQRRHFSTTWRRTSVLRKFW